MSTESDKLDVGRISSLVIIVSSPDILPPVISTLFLSKNAISFNPKLLLTAFEFSRSAKLEDFTRYVFDKSFMFLIGTLHMEA